MKKMLHLIRENHSLKNKCLIWILLILVAGCNQRQGSTEIESLKEENERLRMQNETQVENMDSYFATLNEIEENLILIREKEELISRETSKDVEMGENQQNRINEYIKQIGELMENNRQLISGLNRRLRNSDLKIAEFEKSVARLNQNIEEKEIEIQILKGQLGKMNLQVDFLTSRIDTLERDGQLKSRQLQDQVQEMNRAWFAIGSKKELVDNNVISREGGFLGIGRSNRVKSDFNHDFFTQIDISRDFEIMIAGKNPVLITSHPLDSFELRPDEDEVIMLHIIKPERFWNASRYLVIQTR